MVSHLNLNGILAFLEERLYFLFFILRSNTTIMATASPAAMKRVVSNIGKAATFGTSDEEITRILAHKQNYYVCLKVRRCDYDTHRTKKKKQSKSSKKNRIT